MDNTVSYLASVILNIKSWRAFLGSNRLLIPESVMANRNNIFVSTRSFRLTEKYIAQWKKFLQNDKIKTTDPYSFHWPAMMKFYIRELLHNLKVSNIRVLHIGHEAEITGNYTPGKESVYKNRNRLKDICLLKKRCAVLVTESFVEDKDSNIIFHATDYFHVADIPDNDFKILASSEFPANSSLKFLNTGFRMREQKFKDCGKGYKAVNYYFTANMCLRFGLLAGAISLHHQFRLPTRLIYNEMPYLQGMCTGNVVLSLLTHGLNKNITKINIYFNNKLYFPQSVELRYNNRHFELYDEKKIIVAFGNINTAP
jgi:hypothetical protein